MTARAAVLLGVALLACTSGDGTPAPSPSDPSAVARARLGTLAQAAATGSYDATYRFTAGSSGRSGTIRLRQTPPQYRLDITTDGSASYFALRTGIVSCTRNSKTKATDCFLVARPGEQVPDLFDPGVQRLFRDAVLDLAAHAEDYDVTTLTPSPASSSASSSASPSATGSASPSATLPAGECFHVERRSSPDDSGFETGDYCFAADGIPVRLAVATGVLELTAIGPPPDAAVYRPPTKPRELPRLTPSPS